VKRTFPEDLFVDILTWQVEDKLYHNIYLDVILH